MSYTYTVSSSVQYNDPNGGVIDRLDVANVVVTPSSQGPSPLHQSQQIPTSWAALNLAGISPAGFLQVVNRDPTNYVSVALGAGGVEVARLLPGGPPLQLYLGSGFQTPYLMSNTASCWVEYFLTPQ